MRLLNGFFAGNGKRLRPSCLFSVLVRLKVLASKVDSPKGGKEKTNMTNKKIWYVSKWWLDIYEDEEAIAVYKNEVESKGWLPDGIID